MISSIEAKVNIPFAGKYILGGKLSDLNEFRGVSDAVEVLQFDPNAIILTDGGGSIDTCTLKPSHSRTIPYSEIEMHQRINEIEHKKMDYEKLFNLSQKSSDDLRTGINIVKEALLEPTKQIAKNAGFNGDVVVAEIKRLNKGFNANSGKYEDLKDSGILDPTKVIRLALQDSVSIAAMLLTTEVAMADIPEPEAAAPGGPGGDPMGGMGGMGMPGMGGMGMPGMGGMGMPGMM